MKKQTGHERPDHYFNALPDFTKTPGYINVPFILWLDNLAGGWDLLEYAKCRYNKLGHDGPWVPGNNGSEAARFKFNTIVNETTLGSDELIGWLLRAHKRLQRN